MSFLNDQATSGNSKAKNFRNARSTDSGVYDASQAKFPRIEECTHFHYESVDHGCIKLTFIDESPAKTNIHRNFVVDDSSNTFCVRISCKNNSWIVRRNLIHFQTLDFWLHQCVFDRKYSCLPVLKLATLISKSHEAIESLLSNYLEQLSEITDCNTSGWHIFCAPVLHWLEIDNHGHNLVSHALGDVPDINIPAIAAARVVRRYQAQDDDELSLNVGDMVSIIEMTGNGWWRGKQGLRVGSFPSQCVKRIITATDIDNTHQRTFRANEDLDEIPISRKHGKFMLLMRSFLDTRPSKSLLKKKGIFRERVFGCDLGELLHRSDQDVPTVLADCTKFIEKHGIIDGIYRISGVASHIRYLKYEFDSDNRPDLENVEGLPEMSTAMSQLDDKSNTMCDPHSVAGLCKLFFRELPNPLLTYQLYNRFASAVTDFEAEERLLKVHDAIQQLPPPHYRTLKHLITHLRHMAEKAKHTSMHCRNLAIVWAPNLLRSRELEAGLAAFTEARVQSVVAEFLIVNGDLLFSEKLQTMQYDAVNKLPRPRSLMVLPVTKLISLEEAQARSKTGIVSPVSDLPSPTKVNMREWPEKSLSVRRKRRQKKSTSVNMANGSSSPHPVRTSRKQMLRQTQSVYGANSLNLSVGNTPSPGKTGSQGWKLKLGSFLKKSPGSSQLSFSKRSSLRRTQSADSLISHNSLKQFRNSDPLIDCSNSLSQSESTKVVSPDRGHSKLQAPQNSASPSAVSGVRMRNKSRSPQKSRNSRPSGVIYSDNVAAPVKRRETFQITFRKVNKRSNSVDTDQDSTFIDHLAQSPDTKVSPDLEPSPNPFSELFSDFPNIMGERGLDFDPLNYGSSVDKVSLWADVIVPPYIPHSNMASTTSTISSSTSSNKETVKTLSTSARTSSSITPTASDTVGVEVATDDRFKHKSVNYNCNNNVSTDLSDSVTTDCFNVPSFVPTSQSRMYLPADARFHLTGKLPSTPAVSSTQSVSSSINKPLPTSKKFQCFTSENMIPAGKNVVSKKLPRLFSSTKTPSDKTNFGSSAISVQVYDVPKENRHRRDGHYGSFIALVGLNNEEIADNVDVKTTKVVSGNTSATTDSLCSNLSIDELIHQRQNSCDQYKKGSVSRQTSFCRVYSPRLNTFNPEGKKRTDYQKAILSPRYGPDSCYPASNFNWQLNNIADTHFRLDHSSLDASDAKHPFNSSNESRSPIRQHIRSHSADDTLLDRSLVDSVTQCIKPIPLPRRLSFQPRNIAASNFNSSNISDTGQSYAAWKQRASQTDQ